MKNPKVQNAVLKYLARTPFSCNAATIERGIGMKNGNIYTVLQRLVQKNLVVKEGKAYRINDSARKAVEVSAQPRATHTPVFNPNPLISIYAKEIQYVEDGIDSLMITKSYLQRRIEQLKTEDVKRARTH